MGFRIITFFLLIAAEIMSCVAFYFDGKSVEKRKFYRARIEALDICEALMNEKCADRSRTEQDKYIDAGIAQGIQFAFEAMKNAEEARHV